MPDFYNNNYGFWNSYKHDMQNTGSILPIPIFTSVEETNNPLLSDFELFQSFPNPFNPTTTINYQIPEFSFVTLKVYDVLGNEVATLVSEEKPTGSYEVEFNATTLPSGIYFYRLQAGSFFETKKMVLMK
ncbi:MAG: T9SS type A sorting domain-containing protein [Ignavibacteriaceae bacterium]|nr:T9SS type A sorting domain-containing protein [Ignavibacteriaceae bacterium]